MKIHQPCNGVYIVGNTRQSPVPMGMGYRHNLSVMPLFIDGIQHVFSTTRNKPLQTQPINLH